MVFLSLSGLCAAGEKCSPRAGGPLGSATLPRPLGLPSPLWSACSLRTATARLCPWIDCGQIPTCLCSAAQKTATLAPPQHVS